MPYGMVEQVSSKQRIYNALMRRRLELDFENNIAYIGEGTKEIVEQIEILELKVIPYFEERL
jgi:hypothetical protein